jgi:hypothetical protein
LIDVTETAVGERVLPAWKRVPKVLPLLPAALLAPPKALDVQRRVEIEESVGSLARNAELARRVLYVPSVAFQELDQALQLFELSSAAAFPASFVRDRFVGTVVC